MFRNINANLVQIKNLTTFQIKEVKSLREDLSSLNDSVSNLSTCLQEHKQQTTAELAQLQTSHNTTQSSLVTHAQQFNQRLDGINSKLEVLNASFSQSKQQTAKLNTLTDTLFQHQQQTALSLETASSKLDVLTSTTAQLSTGHQQILANISDVECVDTEESSQLHQNLQNNLTHQLETIRRYVDQIPVYTCGGTGGWRRVVYLDMTDPSTTCPSGWNMTGYSKRTCGRATNGLRTCDSVTFPVSGVEYSRVCGRIKAYQFGATRAFLRLSRFTAIDDAYVCGISVTHNRPRQHIWTFAAGHSESNPTWFDVCPCDTGRTIRIPPFVGNDYFCESGLHEPWDSSRHHTLHSNDTLWDGENCLSSSTCCSLHNPPYFVKQLPTPTTDDIEARICLSNPLFSTNIAVELIELYVQ